MKIKTINGDNSTNDREGSVSRNIVNMQYIVELKQK